MPPLPFYYILIYQKVKKMSIAAVKIPEEGIIVISCFLPHRAA